MLSLSHKAENLGHGRDKTCSQNLQITCLGSTHSVKKQLFQGTRNYLKIIQAEGELILKNKKKITHNTPTGNGNDFSFLALLLQDMPICGQQKLTKFLAPGVKKPDFNSGREMGPKYPIYSFLADRVC